MPQYVPRERKHRRLAKQKSSSNASQDHERDANAETIIPESRSEREQRREKLAQDVRAQYTTDSKVSGKKKKRLDKYVDQKLRKEENLALLKKLAAHKVDTSLLKSSKTLGRVTESKREKISRALREEKAGIDVDGTRDEILYQRRLDLPKDAAVPEVPSRVRSTNGTFDDRSQTSAREAKESKDEKFEHGAHPESQDATEAVTPIDLPPPVTISTAFGSGLKKSLDGSSAPIIRKRKRRKAERSVSPMGSIPAAAELIARSRGSDSDGQDAESWGGFSSAGSEDEPSEEDADLEEKEDKDSAERDDIEDTSSDETSESDVDSGGEEEDEDESVEEEEIRTDRKQRVSAFKAWADASRNLAVDFTPTTVIDDAAARANFVPRQPSPDVVATSLMTVGILTPQPNLKAVTIERSPEIQESRYKLPVVQEEQKIMEAINTNAVVILCGATGSGKTTQVPQMLLENGYGSQVSPKPGIGAKTSPARGIIGVTQPRRVAATSVAARVATELGPIYGPRVGHQVRYDTKNVGSSTAIKFMTDGVLLREINQDFILSKYSCIVIDEAHERSVNTDILIGMLTRIVKIRAEEAKNDPDKYFPLKLVIMSATLRVTDFAENTRLFPDILPPIIMAEGRQFTVTEHFSRKTNRDYLSEMASKVARGHRKLPAGSMLVFLTSKDDIQQVSRKLRSLIGGNTMLDVSNGEDKAVSGFDDFDALNVPNIGNDYIEAGSDNNDDSDSDVAGLDPEEDEFAVEPNEEDDSQKTATKVPLKPHVLPLFADLRLAEQNKVFTPAPEGHRMIILATNVAETSLTIPGIRYVFDCGRSKEKVYDAVHGIQKFEVGFISKASAAQRAGRAGRTGPGHVYRLYSSAVYEQYFAKHSTPEILRTSLESTVLQLKSVMLSGSVMAFPFPTSPNPVDLKQAERLLSTIGAIGADGRITDTGRQLQNYPVNPRFGKMLILAQRYNIAAHVVAVVAALSTGELYIPQVQSTAEAIATAEIDDVDDSDDEDQRAEARRDKQVTSLAQERAKAYSRSQNYLGRNHDKSDVIKLLTTVTLYGQAKNENKASAYCEENFLREKSMDEIQRLREQLHNIINGQNPAQAKRFSSLISPLVKDKKKSNNDEIEMAKINQIVTAGFLDQIAIRADLLPDNNAQSRRKPKRATEVAYRTLLPSAEIDRTLSLQEQDLAQNVYVHPSSVLAWLSTSEMPEYIVYSHLSQAAAKSVNETRAPRTRMHPLTSIGRKQLAALAEGSPLLEFGKPIGKIEEISGVERQCWVGISLKSPVAGGPVWPMGTWKILQKRRFGVWENEKVLIRPDK